MKVFLVNPPYSRLRDTKESTEMLSPIGLSYIGAYAAQKGFDVALYDSNFNPRERMFYYSNLNKLFSDYRRYSKNVNVDDNPVWNEVRSRIEQERPDVVGISVVSPARGSAVRLAKICKETNPKIKVVLGGYHPTGFPEDCLSSEHVDAVVRGEGEVTFAELAECYCNDNQPDEVAGVSFLSNGKIRHNPDRELIADLDSLPSTLDYTFGSITRTGGMPVQYGRGCPYGCKFCADGIMWRGKLRFRSAENLVAHMEEVVRKMGMREFTFLDGTFNINRRKVIEFCELVIKKKLRVQWDALVRNDKLDDEMLEICRRAGCIQMSVGVETGSQRVLDDIGKKTSLKNIKEDITRIRRHGIAAVSFFCFGMPPETAEDMRATRDLMLTLPHNFIILHIFTPLPGTEYYKELQKSGHIQESHSFDAYGYKSPLNFFALGVTREEFEYWRDEIAKAVDHVNKNGRRLGLTMFFCNIGFYLRFPSQLLRRVLRFLGF